MFLPPLRNAGHSSTGFLALFLFAWPLIRFCAVIVISCGLWNALGWPAWILLAGIALMCFRIGLIFGSMILVAFIAGFFNGAWQWSLAMAGLFAINLCVLCLFGLIGRLTESKEPDRSAVPLPPAPPTYANVTAAKKYGFDVVLEATGDRKAVVVGVMCQMTSLSLEEAKGLLELAPIEVAEDLSKEDAQSFKAALQELGAQVSIVRHIDDFGVRDTCGEMEEAEVTALDAWLESPGEEWEDESGDGDGWDDLEGDDWGEDEPEEDGDAFDDGRDDMPSELEGLAEAKTYSRNQETGQGQNCL